MADLSKRTLDKRRSKIPELLEARKAGKTAYFIMDKLVIRRNDASSVKGHRTKLKKAVYQHANLSKELQNALKKSLDDRYESKSMLISFNL